LPVLHWPPFGIKPQDPLKQSFPATHCWSLEHATKQLAPLQMKGLQVRDGGVTHWPDWLQVAAGVYAPWTQVSVPQTVPAGYIWQPPAPSHRPFVPHDTLPRSLQPLRGSTALAATFRHRPGEPGRLQLRQAPPQALSQQTPSTHWLDSQSLGAVQGTPGFVFPQLPFVVPFKEVVTH
jgi:hypothetical protein